MVKKGDVVNDADEVRTSASQNRATTTLSTEGFFFRAQYLHLSPSHEQWGVGGGGEWEIDGQCNTYRQSQPDLHTAEQGLRN